MGPRRLTTPAGDFGTSADELGTPSGEFGTVTGEFGTPSGEFGTPSGELSTPAGEFGTPSGRLALESADPVANFGSDLGRPGCASVGAELGRDHFAQPSDREQRCVPEIRLHSAEDLRLGHGDCSRHLVGLTQDLRLRESPEPTLGRDRSIGLRRSHRGGRDVLHPPLLLNENARKVAELRRLALRADEVSHARQRIGALIAAEGRFFI